MRWSYRVTVIAYLPTLGSKVTSIRFLEFLRLQNYTAGYLSAHVVESGNSARNGCCVNQEHSAIPIKAAS